jgi:serine/threonine protein phosphatase 1
MTEKQSFAVLATPCRIWAIASVHGERDRLEAVCAMLDQRIEPGDRLVFLGNLVGHGKRIRETIDAALLIRRDFMARPGNDVGDVVLLRGAQEEMWEKLFELQFAVNPAEVLEWMLDRGVGPTIEAYGGNPRDGMAAARQGTLALGRWTGELRNAVRRVPGHRDYMSALRRAAYTEDGSLVLVNAGLDPERPLDAQADTFWWADQAFERIEEPYFGCRLVVRGFDPQHRGVRVTAHTASLDGGAGFGGGLIAACITPDDGVIDVIEA